MTLENYIEHRGMELICKANAYVLCYWHSDNSYVSYKYWREDGKWHIVLGNYISMSKNNRNLAEALRVFADRIEHR